jgi:hypothetical protein
MKTSKVAYIHGASYPCFKYIIHRVCRSLSTDIFHVIIEFGMLQDVVVDCMINVLTHVF